MARKDWKGGLTGGWKGESRRHSLARKGVKTANGVSRTVMKERAGLYDLPESHITKDIEQILHFGKRVKDVFHNNKTGEVYEIWELDGVLYKIKRNISYDTDDINTLEGYIDLRMTPETKKYLFEVFGYLNIKDIDNMTYKTIKENVNEHDRALKYGDTWAKKNPIPSDYEIVYLHDKMSEFTEIW